MSRTCPINGSVVLYADRNECDMRRRCKVGDIPKAGHVSIGIDQSYKRTGISICADGELKSVQSVDLSKLGSKSEKRIEIYNKVLKACTVSKAKGLTQSITIERIRMFSKNFISMDYIESIGALNSIIIDCAFEQGIGVWSVDTRCWKSQVLGTSKPSENEFGVPPEKWPCVEWLLSKGMEDRIKLPVTGRRSKGTFTDANGDKWEYDNDAADSAAIASFWFVGDHSKLKKEN